MPSEYWTVLPLPGNWAVVRGGTCARLLGKVTGRWPPGSTLPNSTRASAVPLVCPGYQASTTAPTFESHGMAIGAPASTTTTVRGLAAATFSINSSCAEGRPRCGRSPPSDSVSSETTTTARFADFAAATASLIPGAKADGVPQASLLEGPVRWSLY